MVAGLAALAGGALVSAPAASAATPIVWYQSVARPSADAPCPANTAEETKAGWTEWAASWEEWAHEGKGGPVCTRSNTWAYEATADGGSTVLPSAGCILTYQTWYADFEGRYYLPPDSDNYTDSDCTVLDAGLGYGYVYAPEGSAQAVMLCHLAFGVGVNDTYAPDVYQCSTPV